jgi:hypothetical protein
MSTAPDLCHYCDSKGNSPAGGKCGFCEDGIPLDTQEDWDNSWGKIFDDKQEFPERFNSKKRNH